MPLSFDEITDLVRAERRRQDMQWGQDRTLHPDTWVRIMTEELGESSAEIEAQNIHAMRDELVQLAAVVFACLESVDDAWYFRS